MSIVRTDSQNYSDIANAIRSKNGEATQYLPSEMAQKILDIPTAGGDDIFKHIFNHGGYTGLNPAFSRYNANGRWSYSDTRLHADRWDNGTFVLGGFFVKGNCTKICVDAEVTAGNNGTYNTSGLYLVYCKNGFPSSGYATGNNIISFTNYNNRTNYDGSSPWYTLKRQICEGNLSNITDEPFYLLFHKCDADVNVYSIWME